MNHKQNKKTMEILAFVFCVTPILIVFLFATAVHYLMEALKKQDNEKSI